MKERLVDRDFICDLCLECNATVAGSTQQGHWAYMCQFCHQIWGIGLGQNKGQKLVKTSRKVEVA